MTANDTLYMQRCLDLAALATGYTSPNPLVGAILVHQDRIIGEGYHHRAGEPHAEVNCFASVRPEDEKWIAQSTLYVSLEPCSHYGKTPPCAELVLQKRVPRVVVAMQDPFPEVAGRGIALLRSKGVEVEVGVLEEEARRLNRFFLTAVEKIDLGSRSNGRRAVMALSIGYGRMLPNAPRFLVPPSGSVMSTVCAIATMLFW